MAAGPVDRDDCVLVVVDVQARLAPAIHAHLDVVARIAALAEAARAFGVPVLATEHAPERVGPLLAPIRDRLASEAILRKSRFAATREPGFERWFTQAGRGTAVLVGMETHVCVLQTALGLLARGTRVLLAADATGSRAARADDRRWAIERMRDAGATIAGTETLLFEWTRDADDPAFRAVLGHVKALPPAG